MTKCRYVAMAPLAALAISIPAPARTSEASPSSIAALRIANHREVTAFLATDADSLAALWSNDFLVTNPLNKVATKAEVLGMVRGGQLSFKSYKRQIETIRRYDKLAIVIGRETVEWAGEMPLAGKLLALRFTAVWRLNHGRWQQLVRHANVVGPSR